MSVLLNHGMVVHLSEHIKGLVPPNHLSDIVLKNPEKKYVEGMKIKCRVSAVLCFVSCIPLKDHKNKASNVQFPESDIFTDLSRAKMFPQVLSVDVQNKKLFLTRKKAMIESTLPLFLSYADARRGHISHGYIVSIKDFGCIVRFYNDVKGLVLLSELSSEPIISPEEVFYVGQVGSLLQSCCRILVWYLWFCF